jgi:hypothetical protein
VSEKTDDELKADAAKVGEYVIAKLDALPGDLVVVTTAFENIETVQAMQAYLQTWSEAKGHNLHWLVLPKGAAVQAQVRPLSEDEIGLAGAEGFPGAGLPGMVADDSMPEEGQPIVGRKPQRQSSEDL